MSTFMGVQPGSMLSNILTHTTYTSCSSLHVMSLFSVFFFLNISYYRCIFFSTTHDVPRPLAVLKIRPFWNVPIESFKKWACLIKCSDYVRDLWCLFNRPEVLVRYVHVFVLVASWQHVNIPVWITLYCHMLLPSSPFLFVPSNYHWLQ